MTLPVIAGLIRRRLLINFRVDPAIVSRILPAGMRPKLQGSHAIAGICLIRLEQIRPKGLPAVLGIASENAAHRIAVEWTGSDGGPEEGVFIPRRDTGSMLNAMAGGRLFPGEHHHAKFEVQDDGRGVALTMTPEDGHADVAVSGAAVDALPGSSCFGSLDEASAFFSHGCTGYSTTRDPHRLDGLKLITAQWRVHPFDVTDVHSGYFTDETRFPKGSIEFDHGLVMRDIAHEWHALPAFDCAPACETV
jgi:hypothetical protein